MTTGAVQIAVLGGASLCLVGLAISGYLVMQAQGEEKRRGMRLAAIVAPPVRTNRVEVTAFTAPLARQQRSTLQVVAWIFAFDLEKTALYPVQWWIVLIATFGLTAVMEYLASGFIGTWSLVSLPAGWVMLSRNFFGWVENRRRQALLAQFPDALAMIVRSIRVGIPVMEAVRAVSREIPAPTGPEFGRLVDQVAIGSSLEDAVIDMARRSGLAEYRFFATSVALQNQTGGTLSDTLENLADVIRKRAALRAKGHAMTSEARSSAMILAALPFVTGGMLYVLNPTYIMILFTDPTGKSLFTAAVISLGVGLAVIRAIIRKSLP
jgi:tight adherence protein B